MKLPLVLSFAPRAMCSSQRCPLLSAFGILPAISAHALLDLNKPRIPGLRTINMKFVDGTTIQLPDDYKTHVHGISRHRVRQSKSWQRAEGAGNNAASSTTASVEEPVHADTRSDHGQNQAPQSTAAAAAAAHGVAPPRANVLPDSSRELLLQAVMEVVHVSSSPADAMTSTAAPSTTAPGTTGSTQEDKLKAKRALRAGKVQAFFNALTTGSEAASAVSLGAVGNSSVSSSPQIKGQQATLTATKTESKQQDSTAKTTPHGVFADDYRKCAGCSALTNRTNFSKNQWRKNADASRCSGCIKTQNLVTQTHARFHKNGAKSLTKSSAGGTSAVGAPVKWKKAFNPSGRKYYWNTVTRGVQWHVPTRRQGFVEGAGTMSTTSYAIPKPIAPTSVKSANNAADVASTTVAAAATKPAPAATMPKCTGQDAGATIPRTPALANAAVLIQQSPAIAERPLAVEAPTAAKAMKLAFTGSPRPGDRSGGVADASVGTMHKAVVITNDLLSRALNKTKSNRAMAGAGLSERARRIQQSFVGGPTESESAKAVFDRLKQATEVNHPLI